MKAARIHAFGDPKVLELDDIVIPTPGPNEVLVRVCAASINPVDYKVRSGRYPIVKQDALPIVLGRDVAGVVDKVGEGTTRFKPDDEIFAFLDMKRGGYAEFVAIPQEECAHKPTRLGFPQAAAVPLAGLTAWQGLFEHGLLAANQGVLIHGGAGGVGHLAVQFAKAKGAWVATTVGSQDVEFARSLGADKVVDYQTQRFEDEVKDVDVVLDLIGGDVLKRSFATLTQGGTLVSTLERPSHELAAQKGIRAKSYRTRPDGTQLSHIARLIDQNKVTPHVLATYALQDVQAAHERAERHHVRGKIVLTMSS